MELGLSLGGDPNSNNNTMSINNGSASSSKPTAGDTVPDSGRPPVPELGFCMALGNEEEEDDEVEEDDDHQTQTSSEHTRDGPLQLALVSRAALPLRLSSENGSSGSSGNLIGFGVNEFPLTVAEEVTSSTFPMDFSLLRGNGNKKDTGVDKNDVVEGDEDEGLNSRKKLRLSKQQSAFLEESFKEHNSLTPKQKLALAKQLNLRPRQVEVWFQNRRARTKLKQTEVDCEYLKRCCETLTEENRKLNKELQELRALKASNPFHMQLPPTTLTMCPSCERVATTAAAAPDSIPSGIPFFPVTSHTRHQSAAS